MCRMRIGGLGGWDGADRSKVTSGGEGGGPFNVGRRPVPASFTRLPHSQQPVDRIQPDGASRSAADPAVTDEVLQALRDSVDDGRYRLIESFVPLFLGKATAELLEERATEDLARMCLDSLDFLDRSRPDRVDVEVVNPDQEGGGWTAPVTATRSSTPASAATPPMGQIPDLTPF